MAFIDFEGLPKMELFPGALSGLVAGENMMLSSLVLEQGAVVPEHSHPHEQAGLMLSGKLKFRIGEEERELVSGDAFIIPGNVVHSGLVTQGPVRLLDIFCPIREDYVAQYNSFTQTSEQTVWQENK